MTNPNPAMQIVGALTIVGFLGLFVWAIWESAENDETRMEHRATLQSMERVGEVELHRNSAYLWSFEFEGKQCLWITHGAYRGGLTCWEKTT